MCESCKNIGTIYPPKKEEPGKDKVIYVIIYSYLALENDDFAFSSREFFATSAIDAESQCKKRFEFYDTLRIHNIYGPYQRVFWERNLNV